MQNPEDEISNQGMDSSKLISDETLLPTFMQNPEDEINNQGMDSSNLISDESL